MLLAPRACISVLDLQRVLIWMLPLSSPLNIPPAFLVTRISESNTPVREIRISSDEEGSIRRGGNAVVSNEHYRDNFFITWGIVQILA